MHDAAQLLATLCKQNKAALMKIIEDAVRKHEISFWGLSHAGSWRKGMFRVLHGVKGKMRVRPETASKPAQFSLGLESMGRMHTEAMGVNPAELVTLLQKRGRKIPEALMSFAAVHQQPGAPLSVELPEKRQAERYQACIDAGLPFSSNPLHPMPRGISAVAKSLGISRQSLAADLVKHIERQQNKSS